ncbi:hypothetical protein PSHT_02735, partial [Puccinia striiformis]
KLGELDVQRTSGLMDRAKRQRFHEECGAKLGRAHRPYTSKAVQSKAIVPSPYSEHGLPIFPTEADRVQKSRQPEIAPIAPSPPTQIKKNTLPNSTSSQTCITILAYLVPLPLLADFLTGIGDRDLSVQKANCTGSVLNTEQLTARDLSQTVTNTQIMAENCAKCRKSSDAPLFAGWCQKCVRSMRGPSTSGLDKHQTSPQKTSSSSTSPAPIKRNTSASTSTTKTASIEHFRSAVTAKRKKPNADPYPKKIPTQTTSKDGKSLKAVKAPSAAEAKFSQSPDMRFIECGLNIYRGRKCAGEPLTFNEAKTFINTLPRHPEECLSLVCGKSRLPDLQALTFVIHKSTEKKPVQIDLKVTTKLMIIVPSDSTQVARKKAACKRGATQQSRGSSPDMITEVPTKKAASSRPKPRKVASQHLPDDFSSDSIKVHTTKQASARQKRQRVPSDHETTESDEIESWEKRAEMEPDAWALGGIAGKEQFSWLEAHALPIILRVAHESKVGQGTMRKAFKTEIRSFGSDGSMTLVEYVAKTRYKEPPHKITSHAADALMYEASGLLLDEFKNTLSQCSGLDGVYKKKVLENAVTNAMLFAKLWATALRKTTSLNQLDHIMRPKIIEAFHQDSRQTFEELRQPHPPIHQNSRQAVKELRHSHPPSILPTVLPCPTS